MIYEVEQLKGSEAGLISSRKIMLNIQLSQIPFLLLYITIFPSDNDLS